MATKAKKRGFLVLIPADVSAPEVRTEFKGKAPEYADLRKAVGGLIQPVSLYYQGRTRSAYVNEEGLLHGMRPNPRASRMWREWGQRTGHGGTDTLVGPAVIVLWEKVETAEGVAS